jgi:hypothetical protein
MAGVGYARRIGFRGVGGGGTSGVMTFIGTRTSNTTATPADYPIYHEGLSGDKLSGTPSFRTRMVGAWGVGTDVTLGSAGDPGVGNRGVFEDLFVDAGHRRAVVVIHIGVNDADTGAISTSDYELLVRRMWAIASSASPTAIVGFLICTDTGAVNSTTQARVATFNAAAPALVSTLTGLGLPAFLCDTASVIDRQSFYDNDRHFGAAQTRLFAQEVWDTTVANNLNSSTNCFLLCGDSRTEGPGIIASAEGQYASYRPWLYYLAQGNTLSYSAQPSAISGLTAWYDNSTLVNGGSGFYTGWNDSSGNGRHLTAAATQQPATGRTLNGLAVPDFDGTNDRFSNTSLATSSLTASDGTRYDVFGVVVPDVISSNNASLHLNDAWFSNGNNTWRGNFRDSAGTRTAPAGHADPTSRSASGTGVTLSAFLANVWYNGTSISTRIGTNTVATQVAAAVTGTGLSNTTFVLGATGGATDFFDGAIAEFFCFNRSLDSWERYQLRQYLSAKWGVSV